MTSAIFETFRKQVTITLVPDGGGKFEISLDGELVFSKLKEKRFPSEAEVAEIIEQRL